MKKIILPLISGFILTVAMAQHPLPHVLKKNVRVQQSVSPRTSVKIFALMVEFQNDDDSRTTGDGTFLTPEKRIGTIDPPPHDSAYFANKILFQHNYFLKVSDYQLNVTGTVWGKPIKLSQRMSAYAPPTDRDDYSKLVECITESWRTADSLYPEIDFSQYDAFVIFHAGAGRDIDLVSLLGYNPTPYDLPSLFVDSSLFAQQNPSRVFDGIPVDGGNVTIKHTIFLPEMESRVLPTSPPETLQLSVNGLFAGMIGSFLGLPDLFDTKTGRSGIGQFGLMDGAGMFAYSGLFPPEPSAWEKIELGWKKPIVVTTSQHCILGATDRKNLNFGTILKIPISDREYFLVENRNRDPNADGQKLTLVDPSGSQYSLYFKKDTTGFNQYSIAAIYGSVIDVEDYDWALPGYMDSTHRYDGGGILIWHIDEAIIENNRATNTINAGPIKGVRLMEADGSQDIGKTFGQYAAGSGTEYGSALDFWFNENPAPFYKNRFDATTYPNSKSNSGAKSLITLREFSNRSPIMTVEVEIGDVGIKRLEKLTRRISSSSGTSLAVQDSFLVCAVDSGIVLLKIDGRSVIPSIPNETVPFDCNTSDVAFQCLTNHSILIATTESTNALVLYLRDNDSDGTFENILSRKLTFPATITTPPVIVQYNTSARVLIGDSSGKLWFIDSSGTILNVTQIASYPISSIAVLDTLWYATAGNTIYSPTRSITTGIADTSLLLVAFRDHGEEYVAVASRGNNEVQIYTGDLQTLLWNGSVAVQTIVGIAVGDVSADGYNEILINGSNKLIALNRYGVMVDRYPIQLYDGSMFVGTPLILDCTNDGYPEVIVATSSGTIVAYDRVGTMVNGFPLQATSQGAAQLAAGQIKNNLALCSMSDLGYLTGFEFEVSANGIIQGWTQRYGNAQRTNSAQESSFQPITSTVFLPQERVYNWPNPVYGSTTYIRFYVAEDAEITVKIFDLAGTTLTTLKSRAYGGQENEIPWNVSNIQSGIYFAHLEAKNSRHTATKVIKIAVVK